MRDDPPIWMFRVTMTQLSEEITHGLFGDYVGFILRFMEIDRVSGV